MIGFILPALMLIASVGLYFGYIDEGYANIQDLRAESVRYDDALMRTEELMRLRDELNSTYRTLSPADLERLQTMIPDSAQSVALAHNLDVIATTHGLTLSGLSLVEEAQERPQSPGQALRQDEEEELIENQLQSATVTFEAEGPYSALTSFLRDLERNARVVDILELEFVEGRADGVQAYQVKLRIYWMQ